MLIGDNILCELFYHYHCHNAEYDNADCHEA
jgi:hypothetical protein